MPKSFIVIDSEEDESEGEDAIVPPTINEAYSAIQTLRNFAFSRENVPSSVYGSLDVVEDYVENEKCNGFKQKKITDFFK